MANDAATLGAIFWDSAEVIRYGVGENLYGAAEIAAFRGGTLAGGLAAQPCRVR